MKIIISISCALVALFLWWFTALHKEWYRANETIYALRIANHYDTALDEIQKFEHAKKWWLFSHYPFLDFFYLNDEIEYQRAVLLYANGETENAEKKFRQLTESENLRIASRARYNTATITFERNDFQSAEKQYIELLKIDPSDEDAKINLELIKQIRKEMRKRAEQSALSSTNYRRDNEKDFITNPWGNSVQDQSKKIRW
ncbi:MAG: tetratricopeptide repeat protein [Parcubacteria group bacterium]|nr:tetratricopeptide repeat protein [Parcubacteria group bacterium]